jgi:hypothetical protein
MAENALAKKLKLKEGPARRDRRRAGPRASSPRPGPPSRCGRTGRARRGSRGKRHLPYPIGIGPSAKGRGRRETYEFLMISVDRKEAFLSIEVDHQSACATLSSLTSLSELSVQMLWVCFGKLAGAVLGQLGAGDPDILEQPPPPPVMQSRSDRDQSKKRPFSASPSRTGLV